MFLKACVISVFIKKKLCIIEHFFQHKFLGLLQGGWWYWVGGPLLGWWVLLKKLLSQLVHLRSRDFQERCATGEIEIWCSEMYGISYWILIHPYYFIKTSHIQYLHICNLGIFCSAALGTIKNWGTVLGFFVDVKLKIAIQVVLVGTTSKNFVVSNFFGLSRGGESP